MAFPQTPLASRVELYLSGAWTDVTDYAYVREGITIQRGRSDESSGIGPSSCRLVLNNRDGRFSPRNPVSPYYGQLTRNTPIRVSTTVGGTRLVASDAGARATTLDSAALSITGDIDLRLDMRMPQWINVSATLLGKFTDPTQLSYAIVLQSDGKLTLFWSADGANWLSAYSTVPLPQTTGRQAIRATLDVDNGAAGRTITFYTAPTISGTWTQLGSAVVQAGVTSIFDSTSITAVGTASLSSSEIYGVEIRQGIGGALRASVDFTAQAEGALTYADAATGATWGRSGTTIATATRYRFHGEVASWPQSWDIAGVDVRTSVEAAGVFRRLGQGADPLKSTIQRWVLRGTVPVYGYWPMEDATGSTSIASGLSAGYAMTFTGTPDLASNDTFGSSNPLPVLAGAAFGGFVAPHTATGTVFVQMLVDTPAAGEPVDGCLLRIYTTGTASRWDVTYNATTDVLSLTAYDGLGVTLFSSASAYGPNGKPLNLKVQLVQNGGNIDWGLFLDGYVDPTPGLGPHSGTLAGQTVGAARYVQINPEGVLTESAVGQLVVFAAVPPGLAAEQALRGYISERAGRRVERLCSEEGIPFTGYGDLDDTVAMGPQRPDTLLNLLAEAEQADLGQVFESRDNLGIGYRTRESLQYQAATLALAYGNLTDLQPVEDDQGTRNDITVSRVGGSSVRVTLDSGPLSTLPPPAGVGRYTDSVELSLWKDTQLADQAQIRLTLGTVDEARYPEILVRLETSAFAASPALTDAALRVDHGDLITITGLPTWLPPDQVRQHTIGQTETLGVYEYAIGYVCVPVTPSGVSGLWDALGRWSGNGSTLSAGITSSAMTFAIVTPTGAPLWTTSAADFPLDIVMGGEEITLSAISGAASPQTATVSARSVNGVVKAHSAGAAIDVADPFYYSL